MMMITVIALDHWDDNDNGFDDGSDHNGDGCCGSVPPFFNFFQAIDPGTICQLRSETWKNHHLFKHNLNSPWKKHVAGNCFMWKLSFRHEFIIKPVWASTSPPLDLCRGLLVPKYISTHRSCLGLIWPWFLDAIASSVTKVMLLWNDFFLNFQWIHWSEMTVLYLYLVVWGVTNWAFSISGSNCSHTVVLCHFHAF